MNTTYSPGEPGQWDRGGAPLPPHKPDRGHKQGHDPLLAKSRRFSWEILDEMLH